MELKIVKKPLQDQYTKLEDVQYPGEKWCVKTSMYREGDGGLSLWFKEIERVNPDVVYLYEIRSWIGKIANGNSQEDWIEDTIYSVRYDFKKQQSCDQTLLDKIESWDDGGCSTGLNEN